MLKYNSNGNVDYDHSSIPLMQSHIIYINPIVAILFDLRSL